MKSNEIALIILIVSICSVITYFVSASIFESASLKPVEVEKVVAISDGIEKPSAAVFNENALNPTVPSAIGGGATEPPFGL
jgi:hypothetical protein